MSCNKRPSGWWLLVLLLVGGGIVWVVRALRDDDVWTDVPAGPSGAGASEPEAAVAPSPEPAAQVPAPVPTTPAELRADVPDDLTRIEGVGPKIGAALVAAGLTTFASVAEATEYELRSALTAARLRFAPSLPTWGKQARLLADGDEDGFVALTARLVGGREV
jgi:predicted flap endonuclease-1-like 5' DNA nuclease